MLLIDLYTVFMSTDDSVRASLLGVDDKFSAEKLATIANIFNDEITSLHRSGKKSSNIARGGDDEQEHQGGDMDEADELTPEFRRVIHERQVCGLAARLILAIIAGAIPKSFSELLRKHKGELGQSYDKLILELGIVEKSAEQRPAKGAELIEPLEAIEVLSEPARND